MNDAAGGAAPRRLRYHSRLGALVRAILARRGSTLLNLDAEGRRDLEIVRRTRALVPLLMHDAAALHIIACVRAVLPLGGIMAEAGVLMGGSARLICEAKGSVPLHLFDVFDSLQHDTGDDGAEIRRHFGPVHGSEAQVAQLLSGYEGVTLHPGVFPGAASSLQDARFSFVHLDMDLATSTRDALRFFAPRMLPGGIIIGDDYADPGVRGAFSDHFAGQGDTLVALPWAQVMVVKQG